MAFPATASALTGPIATVDVNGLVLTLRAAAGPYFLRELLPVDISLANHTNATLHVRSGCGRAFYVTQEGGGAPTYQMPSARVVLSCPGAFPTDLAPGQTLSASDLLLLTASGHLTVTAHVSLDTVTTFPGGGWVISNGPDPFAGREPTLPLTVAASAPPNRTVGLWRFGTRVFVIAPPQALAHLVYMYSASAGGCQTSNFAWQPITMPVLDEHPCAGRYGTWSYAVGAPGYAVASETVSSS